MSITGYSDRINHAFAFAAKHHADQVWKGTSRVPYFTHPANMAVILTRYGQDEETVLAGILYGVVADSRQDASGGEALRRRIADKFGQPVLETLLQCTERATDDDGIELSVDERKDDLLERLARASAAARWVCAADAVQSAGSLVADLRRTEFPEHVWGRFAAGREGTLRWYRRLVDRLRSLGFATAPVDELAHFLEELEQLPAPAPEHVAARGR